MIDGDDVLLRSVEIAGHIAPQDVLVSAGVVAAIASSLPAAGARAIDAAGAALLPGLHDHHCHLLAAAAASESVQCGPPQVGSATDLRARLLAAAPRRGWVRGVGYDESVAGDLDRFALDRLRSDVPVRVQHRSGALWVVNSIGLDALGLPGSAVEGVERDAADRPTGRLWRVDAWLRYRLGPPAPPDLAELSARLATFGVTGVTDATPDLDAEAVRMLTSGAVRQRLTVLGADSADLPPDVTAGPRKIVVADHALPTLDELAVAIGRARPNAVAVHCVTRAALLLTIVVLREIGTRPGDRIEHAAVTPGGTATDLAELGLTVVTQPSLVALRGDEYLDRVDADDLDALWPYASLLAAHVPVGGSSDAPYGDPDPWASIRAARDRCAPSGRIVAGHERVSAARALDGFLTAPDQPGGEPRTIRVGAPADLVLLDRPLAPALRAPSAAAVRMTMIGGSPVYERAR